jgi:hypothetical protein
MEAMMKPMILTVVAAMLFATPALAACPTTVPGDSIEAVQANQQRIICLQRELAEDADRQRIELDIQMLEMRQQSLELKQRFDALPAPAPPLFPEN